MYGHNYVVHRESVCTCVCLIECMCVCLCVRVCVCACVSRHVHVMGCNKMVPVIICSQIVYHYVSLLFSLLSPVLPEKWLCIIMFIYYLVCSLLFARKKVVYNYVNLLFSLLSPALPEKDCV